MNMSRSVGTYLVCVAALSLGGCFKHHTVEEGTLVPLEDEGDGDAQGDGDIQDNDDDDDDDQGDGDEGGDGDDGQPGLPFCDNPDNATLKQLCDAIGGGSGGDGDSQIPGLDCKKPADEITKAICQLTGGGIPTLPGGDTTIPGLQCLRPADELTALLCGLVGGAAGGGTGGAGDIGELLGIDCENPDEGDFFAQLVCGGGFGGTGTGNGNGNGNGNAGGGLSAAQCAKPANQFIEFLCSQQNR
jgi:hypothetical protein